MAEYIEGPNKDCLQELPAHLMCVGGFILDSAYKLNWGDLSDDCVMDVGCGVESLKLFQTLFPNFKKVIAMDISLSYINYLKFYQAYGGMEYHLADITDRCTLTQWQGQIPKIVSVYCFNCIKNQRAGFQNIKYLLKPGGEAIFIIALKNPHYECAKYLFTTNKWKLFKELEKEYPDYKNQGLGLVFYERVLADYGFKIVHLEEEFKYLSFSSVHEFIVSEFTKDKVITPHLPEEIHEEFKIDYLNALMKLNGRTPSGQLCLRTSSARFIIRKKANHD